MCIPRQTKIHFFSYITVLLVTFFSFYSAVSACTIFNLSDCTGDGVIYCQPGDTNCSLSGGTSIVSTNINDIEKNDKFSVYIQKVIIYLLAFLGILGVIYIIYAGFNILTAAGDDDKVKKAKSTVFHVIIGLLLIFLAYSIVTFFIGTENKPGLFNAFKLPSLVETTYAYSEYDLNTFDNYKKGIELLSSTLDREYQVSNKITSKTLESLGSLVRGSMTTFSDSDNTIFNINLGNSLITAIELVKRAPDSDSAISNLAKSLNDYLTKVKINRIKGKIIASPETGNAPLVVTLRASEVVDPSGVVVPKASYIWWIRTSGGARSILGTGPSLAYTFPEERTYTVFLNILSSSRNKNGKTDVLPFDSSISVNVLPKLGNISLAINGIYVSNLDKIKFTPAQGRQGLLIDATSSVPASGTKFIATRFDFGNGNIAQYNTPPLLDRQIYSNEGNYKLRMEVTTNENKKVIKELDIEIRDPISSIRSDKTNGFPKDEFRFNASNSAAALNFGYSWQITELESEKSLFTSDLQNISYKFPRTGKYAVKLKTLASNGKDDYDTMIITIEGRDPIASFDTKTLNSESPNTLVLDATRSYDPDNLDASNLVYSWLIDGVRTDLSNPTRNGAMGRYTFDTIGTHSIALEISNKDGKAVSLNKNVSVDSLLSVRLIVSPKIVQASSVLSIIADSKEARTFEWQFGDGETDTTNIGRVNHVYKKSGTYSVNLTVRGRNSDGNSISRKVYVMDSTSPFAIITLKRENEEIVETPDACDGKEAFVIDRAKAITMSAENSVNTDGTNQGIVYTWKYANNRSSSQKDFGYKFDELGCFPITLTVRNQKTGAQDIVQSYIKVENLAPKFSSLTVTADRIDTDPVMVTVTANNAVDDDGVISSYIWYYNTDDDNEPQDFRITRTPKTVFVLPKIGAKYNFFVILEDSNGMKVRSEDMSSERYSLTLTSDNINTPIITLKTSSTSVSVDQKVDFTVSAKNILGVDLASKAEYKWDYNGDGFYEETTNTPVVSHTYDKPGNFNFKVKVTYKGVSNTKYQAITVKNEIVPNLEYIAIGKKFIFLNTTKGLYTKVKWTLGDVTSTTLDSFNYDFGENPVSGNLTLEVSDGTETKSTTTSLRKDIANALKVNKSDKKVIYFSYPSSDADTIHITNSTDKLYLYLGESKGTIAKYGIDTDILVDSNLNGDPADDIDNKGTPSSINGSVFALKSTDVTARKKNMRLSLYDANNSVIGTKDIQVVYDFVAGENTESLSGTLADSLPKDISETDKVNLEKLKDLIKSSKDQDRLKMMQYFSELQENWFDTREKTKTIIDFEAYIDANSALDTKTKESFYSLLEAILLSDSQVKDDVGLATKVLKSLIPKTNPSYTEIMKNIDDIVSHPTNTTLNKELGTFILNAIKDDTTIETKDKNIIKSQLQTIIYGGQNNIPATLPVPGTASSGSGVLDWIFGLSKIFGFILLGILALVVGLFAYFKILNKDDNLGFQDFIIDKISGKKSSETSLYNESNSSSMGMPLQKEKTPPPDILAGIAPSIQTHSDVPHAEEEAPIVLQPAVSVLPEEASVPDWLKASTTLSSQLNTQETGIPLEVVPEQTVSKESIPEETVPEKLSEKSLPEPQKEEQLGEEKSLNSPDGGISDLPDWMKGVDQDSLKKEVEEEMSTPPVSEEISDVPSYDDIPDWLKNSPIDSGEMTEESSPDSLESPKIEENQAIIVEPKQKQPIPIKKQPKAPILSKVQESDTTPVVDTISKEGKDKNIIDTAPPRPKKKKPTPIISEGPIMPSTDEELPDWLK